MMQATIVIRSQMVERGFRKGGDDSNLIYGRGQGPRPARRQA